MLPGRIDELEWKDNDIHVNGLCTTESSSVRFKVALPIIANISYVD